MSNVIIVGSGLSGLFAAAMLTGNVTILEASKSPFGNSKLASSGFGFPLDNDDIMEYANDIIKSCGGRGISPRNANVNLINKVVKESMNVKNVMRKIGFKFDQITAAGGHSRDRIHRFAGKNVGEHVVKKLLDIVLSDKRKSIRYGSKVTRIGIDNDGVYVIYITRKVRHVERPDYVIIATGGSGWSYARKNNYFTTNRKTAKRKKLLDMPVKYTIGKYQIHPTSFKNNMIEGRNFLVPEYLRGLGSRLVTENLKDINYVKTTSETNDVNNSIKNNVNLLTRDRLSGIVLDYIAKGKKIFIQVPKSIDVDFYIKKGLIDEKSRLGEVVPAIHYTLSGYHVNEDLNPIGKNGQTLTVVDGKSRVFVIGESVGNFHGENRLCGASLMCCVTMGYMAAMKINNKY